MVASVVHVGAQIRGMDEIGMGVRRGCKLFELAPRKSLGWEVKGSLLGGGCVLLGLVPQSPLAGRVVVVVLVRVVVIVVVVFL